MNPSLPHGLTLDQVRKYLDNRTQEFGGLGGAIARKDAAGLRMLAHRIKGNAALYGMPELGLCAARVVDAVDAGDWAAVSEKVDAMISRLAEERARFAST
ncbi:MAG: Hpt domain-containing protein [Bdellovibrionales bacterium]|nr:Hpt domain-containing protein [Bdellovibrionales bacterium]